MIKLNILAIDDDEISLKLLELILAENLYISSITTAKRWIGGNGDFREQI